MCCLISTCQSGWVWTGTVLVIALLAFVRISSKRCNLGSTICNDGETLIHPSSVVEVLFPFIVQFGFAVHFGLLSKNIYTTL